MLCRRFFSTGLLSLVRACLRRCYSQTCTMTCFLRWYKYPNQGALPDASLCHAQGCCWDPSTQNGIPSCFYPDHPTPNAEQCEATDAARVDCYPEVCNHSQHAAISSALGGFFSIQAGNSPLTPINNFSDHVQATSLVLCRSMRLRQAVSLVDAAGRQASPAHRACLIAFSRRTMMQVT